MSTILVNKSSGDIPDIEPGVYKVTCVRVKDDTLETPQFGDGEVVKLYMAFEEIEDDDGEPFELDAMANRKISPKSKLTRWAEALGRPIDFESDEEFDTEELVGGECFAKVIRKDENSWPRIDDLTALPKSKGKKKADEGTIDLSGWWGMTRDEGYARKTVLDKSIGLYDGKEPAELTGAERVKLLAALRAE